jgi:hypothetical protein
MDAANPLFALPISVLGHLVIVDLPKKIVLVLAPVCERNIFVMDDYKPPKDYERPQDPKIFDMLVIVGLVFNVLIVIFIVLYWLDLL